GPMVPGPGPKHQESRSTFAMIPSPSPSSKFLANHLGQLHSWPCGTCPNHFGFGTASCTSVGWLLLVVLGPPTTSFVQLGPDPDPTLPAALHHFVPVTTGSEVQVLIWVCLVPGPSSVSQLHIMILGPGP
uniref:Uncharacterized protein n=1 Tax=Cannabis sativa TaxID=3483 RepID=A0A803QRZ5_CANSA